VQPGSQAAADPRPDEPRAGLPLRTWGFVTLGAAGAAFGAALTFELLRRSAEQDAREEREQIAFRDDVERMESRRTAARVFAGAGGFLAVAGGVLIAVDVLRASKDEQAALGKLRVSCASAGCDATWMRRF
jgi:hypothetical protein